MADDFVVINRTDVNAIFGSELKEATIQTRRLIDLLEALVARGFHMFDNTDFTMFEEKHGLPAGSGQLVFDMCNGTLGAMKGTMQNDQALNLMNKVG